MVENDRHGGVQVGNDVVGPGDHRLPRYADGHGSGAGSGQDVRLGVTHGDSASKLDARVLACRTEQEPGCWLAAAAASLLVRAHIHRVEVGAAGPVALGRRERLRDRYADLMHERGAPREQPPGQTETLMLLPTITRALRDVGLTRRDVEFTCSGSADYLPGGTFTFVQMLEAAGAWPPISESHVEMDGAWALYEAWVRLQHGDIDVALVFGGLVGLERSYHGRPAGFRTHALVCVGSALLMLVTYVPVTGLGLVHLFYH